jgi:hypothetical protein
VTTITQHVEDGAAFGRWLPNPVRQLFDAQQRLDGTSWRLVQILLSLGEGLGTGLAGMVEHVCNSKKASAGRYGPALVVQDDLAAVALRRARPACAAEFQRPADVQRLLGITSTVVPPSEREGWPVPISVLTTAATLAARTAVPAPGQRYPPSKFKGTLERDRAPFFRIPKPLISPRFFSADSGNLTAGAFKFPGW